MSEAPVRSGGLEIRGLSRSFVQGGKRLEVLRDLSLKVPPGRLVALVGPSGAGKSTLLHAAGLLEKPDSGEIMVDGIAASGLNDRRRTALRRSTIGFVYQYHHLLPEFSALENIALPQMIAGTSPKAAKARAAELLERIGLTARADHRPGQLSGGEQQRVAIARGLANRPAVLLADEPTGNLDPDTGDRVFALLRELVYETKLAALIATHNLELAARMDAILRLDHGQIEETQNQAVARAAALMEESPAAEGEAGEEPAEQEPVEQEPVESGWEEIVLPAGVFDAESEAAPAPDEGASDWDGPPPVVTPVRDPVHFPEPIPVPDPRQLGEDETDPDAEGEPDERPAEAQKSKKIWNISIKK